MLALAAERGPVNIWNLKTNPAAPSDFSLGPFQRIGSMEFTTDSKSLAISDRRSISLWNVVTGERQWFQEDSSLCATKLKLFPDGKVLVALSRKGAFLVDTSTGGSRTRVDWWSYVLETLDRWSAEIAHISFSESGRSVLFSVSDNNGGVEVLTWDLASRNIDLLNSANQNISGGVYFGWTPDGADTINWRGQVICIMSDIRRYDEEKRTAVGNRVVIAQDDGQFTILDFDESRINEI